MPINLGSFNEKAGPLPVWAWSLVVVGGGYVIYTHFKGKSAASNSTTQDPTSQTPTAEDYQAAQLAAEYSLYNQLGLTTSDLANLATGVTGNTTATQQNTAALNSNTGATNADTAADKPVVAHKPVVIPIRNPHLPPRQAPLPPSRPRTYRVQPGDNLSRIATRYHTTWQSIYNVAANRKVIGGNPNLIKPGQVLVIP